MYTKVRRRETIFAEYIFKYHSAYKENVPIWFNRWEETSLEGGDEFVLNKDRSFGYWNLRKNRSGVCRKTSC